MPCLTMRCADRPASEFPSKVISPADSGTSPDMVRSNVVLPAPFGPITPTASCGRDLNRDVEQGTERAVAGRDSESDSIGQVSPLPEIDFSDARIACRSRRQALEDFSPWSSTITRSTMRMRTPMMCSTQTMVMPMRLRTAAADLPLAPFPPREAAQAFVGKKQSWSCRDRARQFELLERGGSQSVDPLSGRQAHHCEHVFCAASASALPTLRPCRDMRRAPRYPAAIACGTAAGSETCAQSRAGRYRERQTGDVGAAKANGAFARAQGAGDQVEESALARSVGPIRPNISPCRTSNDTRLTARKPPKRLESFATSSIAQRMA